MRGTSWYQPESWYQRRNSSSGLNSPRATRVHITSKLDELNTVLDAGRCAWYPQLGASTAALAAEIHYLSVAVDGPKSIHQQTNKPTNQQTREPTREVRTSLSNKGT